MVLKTILKKTNIFAIQKPKHKKETEKETHFYFLLPLSVIPDTSTYPLGDGDLEDFLFTVFDVLGDLEELLLLLRRLSLKDK